MSLLLISCIVLIMSIICELFNPWHINSLYILWQRCFVNYLTLEVPILYTYDKDARIH